MFRENIVVDNVIKDLRKEKEMDDFSRAVVDCRKKEDERILENASIDHAKELFINLIDEGRVRKEKIAVVSGDLNREFYGQLVEVTRKALAAGTKMALLIVNPKFQIENHPFVQAVLEGGGEVYRAKDKIETPHFIVVGDKRFRVETDHAQTKAKACFNNSIVGKTLRKLFDNLISSKQVERIQSVHA